MKNLTLSLSLLVGAALTIPSLAVAGESAEMQTPDTTMQAEVDSPDSVLESQGESEAVYPTDGASVDTTEAETDSSETVMEKEPAQPYS
ncbi:MAG: hypothetical protein ACTH7W_04385 [Psychrobacter sp.]|uniref:hypothetical protein n=1 Tax=unclassified Psychrobacter TaxID=196806 RepID=UPI0017885A69|nr:MULTISPECIES: hypothetical protein [unclassified Psychrobacter]MBE0442020.1 hypothetical protein [Psychrobacter sp. FME13]